MIEFIPYMSLIHAACFGMLGMLLAILGYFLFDWIDFKIDYNKEIREGNMAAAIVLASFILGICWVIGQAIGG